VPPSSNAGVVEKSVQPCNDGAMSVTVRSFRPLRYAARTSVLVVMAAAMCLGTAGCGAGDAVTTAPETRPDCPTLDEQLAGVYELVEAGELEALAGALSGLQQDLQADLVVTLLRLVGDFEPGTFASLSGLSETVDDSAELVVVLADVVDFIATDGPGAPYAAALNQVKVLLYTCQGPPALSLVKTLLTDDQLLTALTGVLEVLDVQSLVGGLEVDGSEGRDAIRALVRNLLVAASRPDFDVEVILDLMGLLFDLDQPPYDGLAEALRALLGPGETLTQLQGLLGCLQASDPELVLVDLLLDVLLDEQLDLVGALNLLPGNEGGNGADGGGLLPEALAGPLVGALDFLIGDAPARRALVDVLAAILVEEQTPAILGDLSTLLRADLLGDLITTLSNLATRSCSERPPETQEPTP